MVEKERKTKVTKPISFEISTSARDDGTLEAVYVRFNHHEVAETREVINDVLLADVDESGALVGIEILDAVRLADLLKLVDESIRPAFKTFVEGAAPPRFLKAS